MTVSMSPPARFRSEFGETPEITRGTLYLDTLPDTGMRPLLSRTSGIQLPATHGVTRVHVIDVSSFV